MNDPSGTESRSDDDAALHAARMLRASASTYALAGTLIAVVAVVFGTLLVCQQVYDGITLDNITRAHRENVAIWALDVMPFLFGLWGQVASFRMAREAGTLVESGTGQLREELEQERYTARAKTDFFARMSHELRTPLNAIIGMSELLADADDPQQRRRHARVIHESADRLLTLINDVLDFSRIEAGRMEIDSVEFDLPDHLNGAAGLLQPQATAEGLRLISLVPRDAPRRIAGDPGRLRQVLINLLGNAVRFTDGAPGRPVGRAGTLPRDGRHGSGRSAGGERRSARRDPDAHAGRVVPARGRAADRGHPRRDRAAHPDLETVAREAHGLKGASQHVPAGAVTRCVARLEHAALAGDADAARSGLDALVRAWTASARKLETIQPAGD